MVGAMDALAVANRALLRAVGIESLAVQDAPWRSRTVAELWNRRWNRAVGAWLRRFCYAPLARRGHVGLGMLAAFAASAWIHFWPVLVAVGLVPALAMAGFFFAQALLIVIETKLAVARWPAWAGHAWTVTAMLATSPLFCVPMLLVLGLP
jgi:D-alanyl-lipoteichoic acid acyltransferase DltB (MBOAT superfamily)